MIQSTAHGNIKFCGSTQKKKPEQSQKHNIDIKIRKINNLEFFI